MINIDLINKRLAVVLDPRHPRYQTVFILVESLLSSYQINKNSWYLDYDDIGFLRNKLDMLGLVEGRTITNEALNRINWIHSIHERNDSIKRGNYNEAILSKVKGKLKIDLYEDQIPAVGTMIYNRRWGDFDSMGSGKTICAIAAVAAQPEIKKTLVVCPKGVLYGFNNEIINSTYLKPIIVPSGRANALKFIENSKNYDWDMMLINPESLVRTGKKDEKTPAYGEVYQLLESMTWDMLIFDEFHFYKNVSSKRSKCISGLLDNVRDHGNNYPRSIALTGTPISESPTNAYIFLKMFGYTWLPNIMTFERYYCIKELMEIKDRSKPLREDGKPETRKFMKVTGFKNLHELKSRIERVSIRRDKSDMKGFPDQSFIIREVKLKGKQRALYKAILTKIIADLPKSSVINILKFLSDSNRGLRLKQVINHPAILGEEGESAKYEEMDLVLEELFADPEQKAIIWTEYRKAVDLIYERYKRKYGAMKLYGGIEVDIDFVNKLENDFTHRLVVSIPAKAGTGTDFLARARTAIYIDRPLSYVYYNQSLDRIHRRTKENKVTRLDEIRAQPATIIFLDVEHSVDTLIRDKLMRKGDMVDSLVVSDAKLLEMGRKDLLAYLK